MSAIFLKFPRSFDLPFSIDTDFRLLSLRLRSSISFFRRLKFLSCSHIVSDVHIWRFVELKLCLGSSLYISNANCIYFFADYSPVSILSKISRNNQLIYFLSFVCSNFCSTCRGSQFTRSWFELLVKNISSTLKEDRIWEICIFFKIKFIKNSYQTNLTMQNK